MILTLTALADLVMVGLVAGALGRLVALDTVLDPIRRRLLPPIGGQQYREYLAMRQAGIEARFDLVGWRGWIIDGVTCPSCVAWWVGVVLFVAWPPDVDGLVPSAVWLLTTWAIAQLFIKARG